MAQQNSKIFPEPIEFEDVPFIWTNYRENEREAGADVTLCQDDEDPSKFSYEVQRTTIDSDYEFDSDMLDQVLDQIKAELADVCSGTFTLGPA